MPPDDGDYEKDCCSDDWVRDAMESVVNLHFLLNTWKSLIVRPQSVDHGNM